MTALPTLPPQLACGQQEPQPCSAAALPTPEQPGASQQHNAPAAQPPQLCQRPPEAAVPSWHAPAARRSGDRWQPGVRQGTGSQDAQPGGNWACEEPPTPRPASRQPTQPPSPSPSCGAAAVPPSSPRPCPSASCAASAAVGCLPQQARPAAEWLGLQSFVNTVSRSPLLKSALLSLELSGSHPTADGAVVAARGDALGWTLAQLLALHLRARLPRATESSVLASLWLLEAMQDAERSSATAALTDYLACLGAFSPVAVATLSLDWPASFCRMRAGLVATQADLLRRLDWRLRLNFGADVQPCHALLFSAQPLGARAPPCSQASCPHGACWQQRWAAAMRGLQHSIRRQAHLLQSGELRLVSEQHGRPLPEEDAQPSPRSCRPAKHQRTEL